MSEISRNTPELSVENHEVQGQSVSQVLEKGQKLLKQCQEIQANFGDKLSPEENTELQSYIDNTSRLIDDLQNPNPVNPKLAAKQLEELLNQVDTSFAAPPSPANATAPAEEAPKDKEEVITNDVDQANVEQSKSRIEAKFKDYSELYKDFNQKIADMEFGIGFEAMSQKDKASYIADLQNKHQALSTEIKTFVESNKLIIDSLVANDSLKLPIIISPFVSISYKFFSMDRKEWKLSIVEPKDFEKTADTVIEVKWMEDLLKRDLGHNLKQYTELLEVLQNPETPQGGYKNSLYTMGNQEIQSMVERYGQKHSEEFPKIIEILDHKQDRIKAYFEKGLADNNQIVLNDFMAIKYKDGEIYLSYLSGPEFNTNLYDIVDRMREVHKRTLLKGSGTMEVTGDLTEMIPGYGTAKDTVRTIRSSGRGEIGSTMKNAGITAVGAASDIFLLGKFAKPLLVGTKIGGAVLKAGGAAGETVSCLTKAANIVDQKGGRILLADLGLGIGGQVLAGWGLIERFDQQYPLNKDNYKIDIPAKPTNVQYSFDNESVYASELTLSQNKDQAKAYLEKAIEDLRYDQLWRKMDAKVLDERTVIVSRKGGGQSFTLKRHLDDYAYKQENGAEGKWEIMGIDKAYDNIYQAIAIANLISDTSEVLDQNGYQAGSENPFKLDGANIDFDRSLSTSLSKLGTDLRVLYGNGEWMDFYRQRLDIPAAWMVNALNSWHKNRLNFTENQKAEELKKPFPEKLANAKNWVENAVGWGGALSVRVEKDTTESFTVQFYDGVAVKIEKRTDKDGPHWKILGMGDGNLTWFYEKNLHKAITLAGLMSKASHELSISKLSPKDEPFQYDGGLEVNIKGQMTDYEISTAETLNKISVITGLSKENLANALNQWWSSK